MKRLLEALKNDAEIATASKIGMLNDQIAIWEHAMHGHILSKDQVDDLQTHMEQLKMMEDLRRELMKGAE